MKSRILVGIKAYDWSEPDTFVAANAPSSTEQETLAVLENPYCSSAIYQMIPRSPRLTAFYSARRARRTSADARAFLQADFLPVLAGSRTAAVRARRLNPQ